MAKCLIIQPLDKEYYSDWHTKIFEPANKVASLEPYRFDKAFLVSTQIKTTKEKIDIYKACLQETTTGNPNGWCMLCFRSKYRFQDDVF